MKFKIYKGKKEKLHKRWAFTLGIECGNLFLDRVDVVTGENLGTLLWVDEDDNKIHINNCGKLRSPYKDPIEFDADGRPKVVKGL